MTNIVRWSALLTSLTIGCADGPEAVSTDPEDSGNQSWTDAGLPSEDSASPELDAAPEPDAAAEPSPDAHDPCAIGSCWTAPTIGGACGSRSLYEDFSSGIYNVHRFLLLAPPGVDVELTLKPTAGSWDPVLILHDGQGITVHDGQTSLSNASLKVETDSAAVRVNAPDGMHLALYLTDRAVVDGGFQPSLPQDAKYSLDVVAGCTPPAPLTVRGVTLGARQEMWVRYIAARVIPALPGSASERIDKAGYVAWWSLKEGVLGVNNPLSYSNCSFPPDKQIGPLDVCPDPGNAWQVGLSAVQSAWNTLSNVEALALKVHPEKSVSQVLTDAAKTAGFGAATSTGQAVASSTDRLRLSWLLRDGAVGFEAQYPIVYSECFVSEKSWCFGTGWSSSASFAPHRAGADQAVADLKSIFAALSP
jgi:hypothetical protein